MFKTYIVTHDQSKHSTLSIIKHISIQRIYFLTIILITYSTILLEGKGEARMLRLLVLLYVAFLVQYIKGMHN